MVSSTDSTIKITKEVKEGLDKLKIHTRQPYNEVIQKLLEKK